MRTVYFVSALLFTLSLLAVVQVNPQPVPTVTGQAGRWRPLLNRRFLGFAACVCATFVAMHLSLPLASNYLKDVGGWRVARIGVLGSFQAAGAVLLNPLLGRLGEEAKQNRTSRVYPFSCKPVVKRPVLVTGPGLVVGQALVWIAALIMLLAGTFPVLALAYLLRGAYEGCRSLTQAQASELTGEADRGMLFGATETTIAIAQIVAPYAAGWLYTNSPTYPFVASLALIPAVLLLRFVAARW